ncbi:phage neck terminator protein [Labrys neptuniae]
MNDSSTGGYLAPTSPMPPDDDAFDDILQSAVSAITGIPGALVRPRWQPVAPPQPDASVNWCAIGVISYDPDANAAFLASVDGQSQSSQRHERIELLASFYGPAASSYAHLLRDGLAVPQNREALRSNGVAFVGTDTIRAAPELLNQSWRKRFDIPVLMNRQVNRTWPVLSILSAGGTIVSGRPASSFNQPWTAGE